MLSILAAPFIACLVIGAIHVYMGLHIIRRGVIFVDLALAQMAALGATVALLIGPAVLGEASGHGHDAYHAAQASGGAGGAIERAAEGEEESSADVALSYALSLLFAFAGAGLFATSRFRDNRVPHEAIIGICYVVSAALALLILNKSPHGAEKAEEMLLGNILFVGWGEVARTAALYAGLAVPHLLWGRKFLLISEDAASAEAKGMRVRFWDFLFYAIFGVMVTRSVRIGGVLVVFSFLIIPAVCAAMLLTGFRRRLLFGWAVALVASIGGLWFSAVADMPTGSSLVAAFGAALVLCALANRILGQMGAKKGVRDQPPT